MSFSEKTCRSADAELKKRRDFAERSQRERHEKAVAAVPEISALEKSISETGLAAVKAIGMGENAEEYIRLLSEQNLAAQAQFRKLLKKNGFPEDYLQVKYTCSKCRDTGFVGGYRCECFRELLRSLSFSELCGRLPIESSGFDAFNLGYYPEAKEADTGVSPRKRMGEILNFCKSYAADFDTDSPSLLFTGATGLGKTHLSLAIGAQAARSGFGVVYDSAQNLLFKLEKEHFNRSEKYDGAREAMLGCDLLIIDDLGAEFSTTFTVAAIHDIINSRLLACLPTIISTNFTMEELEARYSERVTSRIIGGYTVLRFFGRDVRQLKN